MSLASERAEDSSFSIATKGVSWRARKRAAAEPVRLKMRRVPLNGRRKRSIIEDAIFKDYRWVLIIFSMIRVVEAPLT
jgi:hypothetical protein